MSRQSAWELMHRLRDALKRDVLARKLRGRIEMDETYVGRATARQARPGRGPQDDRARLEGARRARSLVVASMATRDLHAAIQAHVAREARLYTDELLSFRRVRRLGYRHRRVKHGDRFVRGQSHTQAIEGH